jgi:preprotein translocase subunit YajC
MIVNFDPTLLLMGAVLVVLIIFMVRNSRKRRRDAADMQEKVKVGAEVMTNFGVYARIKMIDDSENKVILETAPGQTLTVHRQVISRVVEAPSSAPTKAAPAAKASTQTKSAGSSNAVSSGPQYGERVAKAAPKRAKRPASGTGS